MSYAAALARLYFALIATPVTTLPSGHDAPFWAERCYRHVAGLPDVLSGGHDANYWLAAWYYHRTGQQHRQTGWNYPDWHWLALLIEAYGGTRSHIASDEVLALRLAYIVEDHITAPDP